MSSPFVADVGRAVRGVPRAALTAPRAVLRVPLSVLSLRRLVVALMLALALTAGYTFWLRHSSLVAVEKVDVTGLSFAEAEVSAALSGAAKEMTTLDFDVSELERAVRGYPTVASLSVDRDFPHRLAIEVNERAPVAAIGDGDGVPVAGDGTVLSGIDVDGLELPPIEADQAPASGALDGVALAQAEVLGAAPDPMRPAISGAAADREHGVVVELAGGVELRFGDSRDARAKWAAAAAVLADPKLEHLSYIDLRLPGRPAVGGAPLPVPEVPPEEVVAPPPAVATDPVSPVEAAPAPPPPSGAVIEEEGAGATTPAPPAPTTASGVAGATAAP